MIFYTTFATTFSSITLVGNEKGLSGLHMETGEGKRVFTINEQWQQSETVLAEAKKQVMAYCEGDLQKFSLPLNVQGTDFQKKVWQALQEIPFGEVRTYGQIAAAIGNKKASRAVGMANHKNPLPLIIPCHRVIGANGSLAGFAHGLTIKQRLLDFEKEGINRKH